MLVPDRRKQVRNKLLSLSRKLFALHQNELALPGGCCLPSTSAKSSSPVFKTPKLQLTKQRDLVTLQVAT